MSDPTLPSLEPGGHPDSNDPESSQGMVPVQNAPAASSVLGGRWELLGVLGEGGTATVYRAHDRQSGGVVAVKMLHRDYSRERAMRERFRREAYAANLVNHAAVVQVLGDGEADDKTPYLIMEYLEGETLDQRLERKGGRLPATEVIWAIDKVLDALAAAHGKGIVHRDIKPENIFITHDRRVKVLDFGLARLAEASGVSAKLTQIGFVMGTPSFMPPEQAQGQWDQVDVQTDLWSVGATMFFLLSGRLVHEGAKVHEVVEAATKKAAPSLREVAPHLPEAVVEVVDYALAFEMSKRWRSARLMQHALRQAYHRLRHGDVAPESSDDPREVEAPVLDFSEGPEAPPVSLRAGAAAVPVEVAPLIVQRLPSLDTETLPSQKLEDLLAMVRDEARAERASQPAAPAAGEARAAPAEARVEVSARGQGVSEASEGQKAVVAAPAAAGAPWWVVAVLAVVALVAVALALR